MNRIEQNFFRPRRREIILGAALVIVAMLFAGCGKKAASPPPPPPEVVVVTVATEPLSATTELSGRIEAVRTAEVCARGAGILPEKNYVEGPYVKAGDLLFQIDPAPLQASHESAQAGLAEAEASLKQTQAQADRYQALVKIHAVSQQDFDDAVCRITKNQPKLNAIMTL